MDASIVIPVRGHSDTIVLTVESLLHQEYIGELEVIVVVDRSDSTYQALSQTFDDDRLVLISPSNLPTTGRDTNTRRRAGLRAARGDYLALVDSDMSFGPDWLQTAIRLLDENKVDCVAGVMLGLDDSFLSRYTDQNVLGAKTPRFDEPYFLTSSNFGRPNRKPGITANMVFTRKVYQVVGGPVDFGFSYQDYAFYQQIVDTGFTILCTNALYGMHAHRSTIRELIWEYRTSGNGCAVFTRMFPESGLSRRRIAEVTAVSLLGLAAVVSFLLIPLFVVGAFLAGWFLLGTWTAIKLRSSEGFLYPIVTLFLGTCFSFGMLEGLISEQDALIRSYRRI